MGKQMVEGALLFVSPSTADSRSLSGVTVAADSTPGTGDTVISPLENKDVCVGGCVSGEKEREGLCACVCVFACSVCLFLFVEYSIAIHTEVQIMACLKLEGDEKGEQQNN